MVYRDFFGNAVSRFGVGTVQFGLTYGVNNKTGQTSREDIDALLTTCADEGVTFLDTARAYGSSEERIADALDRLGLRTKFLISTKLDLPPTWESMTEAEVLKAARSSLEGSLAALRVDSIELYLLHTERYLACPALWGFVLRLIDEGTVQQVGVSVEVGPGGAERCLSLPRLSALEIPYNVFDRRWDRAGFFAKAAGLGLLVINRSSFLQGLVLMDPATLPVNIAYVAPYIQRLQSIAEECGMDRTTLSLRYVLSQPGIGTSILGMDTAAQFDENFKIYQQGPLDPAISARIEHSFADVPEHCVNPALWKSPRP